MIDFSAAFSVGEIALHNRIILHPGASCPNLSYKVSRFMGLPWVKVFVSVLDDARVKRLDPPAKLVYLFSFPLARRCDMGGALSIESGPLTIAEITESTGISPRQQQAAIQQLLNQKLFAQDGDLYSVVNFEEKQQVDDSSKRVRKFRLKAVGLTLEDWDDLIASQGGHCAHCDAAEHLTIDHIQPVSKGGADSPENIQALCKTCNSKKNASWKARRGSAVTEDVSAVTLFENAVTLLDRDKDKDKLTTFVSRLSETGLGCRCREQAIPEWWSAEALAIAAIATFTNRRTEGSQRRHQAIWVGQLRSMHVEGHSWDVIWAAISQSHLDGKHAPLHGFSAPWANLRASTRGKSPLRAISSGSYAPVKNIAAEDRR